MNFDRVGRVAAVAAVLTMAATLAWNVRQGTLRDPFGDPRVRLVEDWEWYSATDSHIGPADPKVVITVFWDYTCPNCLAAAKTLETLRERHLRDLALRVRHFPVNNAVSRDAAIAAECGRAGGAFPAMHAELLRAPDSLGLRAWTDLALVAGITDTAWFAGCMADSTRMAMVADDLRIGYRLGVRGTPSFLVNEAFVEGNPPPRFLHGLVAAAAKRAEARQ